MANQDSPLWERLGMDHDPSPHWTSLNMVKALKFGLFIIPPEQQTLERNKAFQMVNNWATLTEKCPSRRGERFKAPC